MSTLAPIVRIVDDDPTVCDSQSFFLNLAGWETRTYSDAAEFLEKDDRAHPGCLILDVRMPKMSGLELQQELIKQKYDIPIIFLSAHGDIEMAIGCVQAGAFNFLVKPAEPEKLLALVQEAVAKHIRERKERAYRDDLQRLLNSLTAAEKKVAALVAKGLSTAKIAEVLEVTERTVQSHRSEIYEKLDVQNPVELNEFFHELGDAS
jgi:FixJ family two-component response regulator